MIIKPLFGFLVLLLASIFLPMEYKLIPLLFLVGWMLLDAQLE